MLLGTLRVEDGKGAVRMEERVGCDIDEVWSALTDPARLAVWLGEIEGDFGSGGEYRARYFASGWEGTGRITIWDPPTHLRAELRPAHRDGGGSLEVWLAADGEGTRVVWEERGMPAEHLPAYGAGIQIHVEDLRTHLAGGEIDHGRAGARFEELFGPYGELDATG